jgi:hypothetical protein
MQKELRRSACDAAVHISTLVRPIAMQPRINHFLDSRGQFDFESFCDHFRLSQAALWESIGLDEYDDAPEALDLAAEAADVLLTAAELANSNRDAYRWFCCQAIPALGEKTAAQLVSDGQTNELRQHLRTQRKLGTVRHEPLRR